MNDLSRFLSIFEQPSLRQFRRKCGVFLVVGCGFAEEYESLAHLFPDITITLLDIDPASMDHIRRRLGFDNSRLRIVLGDAANLSRIAKGPYDVIIMRHPPVLRRSTHWDTIMAACLTELQPGGIVIVTTYTVAEADLIRSLVSCDQVVDLSRLPYTDIPVAIAGNDRYILVHQRK